MNKKYVFLDNIPELQKELLVKSMRQVAKEKAEEHGLDTPGSPTWNKTVNIIAGCIRARVRRYLHKEEVNFVKERKRKKLQGTV